MVNIKVGDRIVFGDIEKKSSWRTECVVISGSDPDIVKEPTHRTFSGMTDSGRYVGGYLDQVVEIL